MRIMEEKRIRKNRILCIGLVLAMLAGGFLAIGNMSMNVKADTEPNDDYDHAEQITAGEYTGHVDSTDTHDYYKTTIGAGQTIYVNVTPEITLEADIALYNEDRAKVTSDGWNGKGAISRMSWTTSSAQVSYNWYISVRRGTLYYGAGDYTMNVILVDQDDGDSGGDAGDSFDNALQVGAGTYSGLIRDDDEKDYYKINITAGQTVSVEVTPEITLEADILLYNEDKQTKISDTWNGKGVISRMSWTTNSEQPYHEWYILVRQGTLYYGEGTYSMEISLTSQNDVNSGGDAADSSNGLPANPTPITPGTYTGFMADDDIRDIYGITVNAGETINVTVTPDSAMTIGLWLKDENNNDLDSVPNAGAGGTAEVSWKATTTEMVYIWLKDQSGYGTYTMELSVETIVEDGNGGDGNGDNGGDDNGGNGGDGDEGGGTPGFEVIAVIAALAIALIILRRRK